MKTNKFLVMAAMALGLGVFAACSDDDIAGGTTGKENLGSTYMSVTLSMPQGITRADDQNLTNPAYNYVGKWAGQDQIEKIEIYVFNDAGKREAKETFSKGQFDLQNGSDSQMNIKPLKAIKVQPGQKKVYVVVNPTSESTNLLKDLEDFTTFDNAYKGKLTTLDSDPASQVTNATAPTKKTVADKIAEVKTNKDVILMTANAVGQVNAEANISEQTTLSSIDKNRVKITVQRAVARVMVTVTKDEYKIMGDDILTQENNVEIGKVKNIKYVVAQGEKALYFQQKASEPTNPNLSFETPGSAYVSDKDNYKEATNYYDYSGLWKGYSSSNIINGTSIPTAQLYIDNKPDQTLGKISEELKNQLKGEFILPNTHEWGNSQEETKYRKGNTAYVLVRAQFIPKTVIMQDGTKKENYTYEEGKDFVLGKNGIFYENNAAAHATGEGKFGVEEQETQLYVKGKVLYYAWVNPDKNTIGWLNSPVLRNNIYHIEITGFKRIGANWNPLVPPADPNHPGDPNDPNNPDPKPNNPKEPNDPPVKPEDPLTPKETWMSVETVVLPWQVHSYSVELGD